MPKIPLTTTSQALLHAEPGAVASANAQVPRGRREEEPGEDPPGGEREVAGRGAGAGRCGVGLGVGGE